MAAILGPVPLALFMAATGDEYRHATWFAPAMFAMAQLWFWVSYLLGTFVARRLRPNSMWGRLSIYAASTFLLSCVSYALTYLSSGGQFEFKWALMMRDSVGLTFASVASLLIFSTIKWSRRPMPVVRGA
jgi:hypothetical protein